MGNSHTSNQIEQSISESMKVLNTAIQQCSTKVDLQQAIKAMGNGNHFENIDFNSEVSVDVSCVQDTLVKNDITQSISNSMQQAAKSSIGALSVTPGNADADNITRNFITLGTQLENTFKQNCMTKLDVKQTIDVHGNDNVWKGISFNSTADIIKSCVQTSSAVNKAKAEILNSVKQFATAEKKGLGLGMMVLVIGIIVVVVMGGGTKMLTSPTLWIAVFGIVFSYGGLAFMQGWWPFHGKKPKKGDEKKEDGVDAADPETVLGAETSKETDTYYNKPLQRGKETFWAEL
jgi:hypothetical protein